MGAFIIALVLFIVGVLSYYAYQLWFSRAGKFMQSLPGPRKILFLGNALDLNLPNEEVTKLVSFQYPKIYGPRFTLSIGTRNYFLSHRAQDIEKLLSSTNHLNKGIEYKFIMPWLGEGLLTSQGSKWFHRRKMLTPSFHFTILEEFMDIYNEQSKIMIDILKKDSDGKKALEISSYIALCTLDIICETAMGRKINAQHEKDSPYVRAIYELASLFQTRSFTPWYIYDFIWNLSPGGRKEKRCLKILHGFTNRVIQERKQEVLSQASNNEKKDNKSDNSDVFMTKKKRAVAFMDLLLGIQKNDPAAISDSEIREETDTFMFEGHDTTATSLCWTIFLFGCYPKVQERAMAELKDIFGDDKDRAVTNLDLTKMKYLECVIKESLRLYPSVPFMARDLTEDLVLEDGLVIPKGFNFSILPLMIHRDPKIWPNPEEFNPDRFSPERANGRHPYAYIPFSAGPRNCIGQKFALMEEKVILSQMLRNFRLESVETREDVILTTEVILRSKNGLHVKFIPRR